MVAPDPDRLQAPARVPGRLRRALPWVLLCLGLVVAQGLLVALTIDYESNRAQEGAERAAAEAAAALRRDMQRHLPLLRQVADAEPAVEPGGAAWLERAQALLREQPGLARIEWRDAERRLRNAADSDAGLFRSIPRAELALEADRACAEAARDGMPSFSRSHFVPTPRNDGFEVVELCLPVSREGRLAGHVVGTLLPVRLLDAWIQQAAERQRHAFALVDADGTRLGGSGAARGANVFVATVSLGLPGSNLHVRADAASGRPGLIPNMAIALVIGLSLMLFGLVILLARDVRRRALAERELASALALRTAMENSLPTGLRARGLDGRVTYANPAFCDMVGFTPAELRAASSPPYWPPEHVAAYAERQRQRLETLGRPPETPREGHETVFMRKSGERFPVMIYEAPLVDGAGRQTGWMGAVLDLSAQRRSEELSRQQQERLQASARLASAGEMASLLAHELNQPLAAIASYASGSLNLIDEAGAPGASHEAARPGADPASELRGLLKGALQRIAEQAERAGRVIHSVHRFVRRREQHHESLPVAALIEGVLPLIRLQARKSGTRVALDIGPGSDGRPLRVRGDRTLLEQLLLNLSRNAIQAMEGEEIALAERVLTLGAAACEGGARVRLVVSDRGHGISPEVARQLFTPFFTTRAEGMGLGLSLCRSVVEQHGGQLEFGTAAQGRGTEFRFTLPAAPAERTTEETMPARSAVAAGSPTHPNSR